MEPLIKESTVRLAEKISVLAEKGETVEVLGWVVYVSYVCTYMCWRACLLQLSVSTCWCVRVCMYMCPQCYVIALFFRNVILSLSTQLAVSTARWLWRWYCPLHLEDQLMYKEEREGKYMKQLVMFLLPSLGSNLCWSESFNFLQVRNNQQLRKGILYAFHLPVVDSVASFVSSLLPKYSSTSGTAYEIHWVHDQSPSPHRSCLADHWDEEERGRKLISEQILGRSSEMAWL